VKPCQAFGLSTTIGGEGDAGCDAGSDPEREGVDGEEVVLRATKRVPPPRTASSSTSVFTLGAADRTAESVWESGFASASCARALSLCNIGYRRIRPWRHQVGTSFTNIFAVRERSETCSNRLQADSKWESAEGARAIRGFTAIEPSTICVCGEHRGRERLNE
jgi:hypothetical protein